MRLKNSRNRQGIRWTYGVAAALFLLPAFARAQYIGPLYGGPYGTNTFLEATLQGTVQAVDLANAKVTITTSGMLGEGVSGSRNVTLNARPQDLAYLNPGDVIAVRYNNYNGTLWLAPEGGAGVGMYGTGLGSGFGYIGGTGDWAQYGTITGAVTSVNRQQGLIAVRGQVFRAHPEQTKGVFPGQFVSLSFAQIGQQPWVEGIQAGSNLGIIGAPSGTIYGVPQTVVPLPAAPEAKPSTPKAPKASAPRKAAQPESSAESPAESPAEIQGEPPVLPD